MNDAAQTDPAFEAPWHAQAHALSAALLNSGMISPREWTDSLAASLARRRTAGSLDGSDDYFGAIVEALEALMVRGGHTDQQEINGMGDRWRDAFLRTPHGRPVTLEKTDAEGTYRGS